jgi:hypothetical protein
VSAADVQSLVVGLLEGITSSSVFVLILFIGFCVVFGFTKLKKTAGGSGAMVIKSLDEMVSHTPMVYLSPSSPRGPVDQLHSPELVELAARK